MSGVHTHADGTVHDDHPHGVATNHVVRGGPPVLDIGGDIGAMVVLMDPSTAGTELFLRSEHDPPIDIHTGVWTRPLGSGESTAAVFPELVEGTYWVLDASGNATQRVGITGGALAELDIRGRRPPK